MKDTFEKGQAAGSKEDMVLCMMDAPKATGDVARETRNQTREERVVALTWLLGTTDFLGLGVLSKDPHAVTIVSAFSAGGAHTWSWLWKLLFTAITLSTGFKGGEVTPLFFIGAALGNTLAVLLGAPVDLFAGLGFIAVFAGASNTPLACTIMGVELFGGEHTMYYAVACFTAYFFSGMSGIYSSQRTGVPKMP